ncbi:hypothetical protein [Streptodolium elevatio]|uniref:Uncharacterized protein n=1 Tax=Streptodolium elevatio TaxID=3157996 RepID=A0ABV3DLH5_9ACTN
MSANPRFEYTDTDGVRITFDPDITEDVLRVVIRVGRESVAVPVSDIGFLTGALEEIAETIRWEADGA